MVTDGRFNNVALRHVFDEKDKGVFKLQNHLSVTFKGASKFDIQNLVVGNLLSQVSASTLTDAQVKKLLDEAEDTKIKARLDALRNFRGGNDDDEDGPGGSSRGGFDRCIKRGGPTAPLSLPPLLSIPLTADLRPPNLPPAPRKVRKKKKKQFPEPMEAEPQDEHDFVPAKTDPIFQTHFTRPKTTLVYKKKMLSRFYLKFEKKCMILKKKKKKLLMK